MVRIMPLLADGWVEENYRIADEVDELFIDELGPCLILVALVTGALSSQFAHSVLQRPTHISRTDAIDPLKFNFDLVGSSHVVLHGLVF